MITPPAKFETRRLLLRLPVIEDADAIFEEYGADPEVTRYVTWAPHESKDTVAEFLRDRIDKRQSGHEFTWTITSLSDNRPIGMIGAHIHRHKVGIGYVLGRRHWNLGYMTEAVSVVTEWMLSQPGVFRVWAVCDTQNVGSARVLEKSHFEREGELRRWTVHPNSSSKPSDCYVYARVR